MSRVRHSILYGAMLVVITLVAYAGVFQNDFVDFDDNIYVTDNPYTRAGVSLAGARYALNTFDSGNWIPLTWISFQLDTSLFGRQAWGYHLTNLVLHSLNVLMLYAWLSRVTGLRIQALVVAALFAVHPLHVESVAWIAERKDVLCAFWLMMTLLAYERYSGSPTLGKYLLVCASFTLGLLSKSMLVTLPILLLVVDIWLPHHWRQVDQSGGLADPSMRRSFKWLVAEKVPLLFLSLIDGIVTIIAQVAVQTRWPFWIRLGNAIRAYSWYLMKTVWPSELSVYYPHPANLLSWWSVLLSAIPLVVITIYVAVNGSRRSHLWFGWLWYLISLSPVIGLVQVGFQANADRYSYIPHIGLLLMIVAEAGHWACRSSLGRNAMFAVLSIVVIACSGMTMAQVRVWRSTDTLWARALAVEPGNWFAHLQVGNRRVLGGQTDNVTLQHFGFVLKYDPKHHIALNNVGWIHQSREEWQSAEEYYRRAIEVAPDYRLAVHNFVTVLKKQGRLMDGADLIERFANRHPTDARIQNELGMIYVRQGRMEDAKTKFSQAVRADSENRIARNNLALALSQLGQDPEAKQQLETVLKQDAGDVNARVNLGTLLERMGQLGEAKTQYSLALQYDPEEPEARERLRVLSSRNLSQP